MKTAGQGCDFHGSCTQIQCTSSYIFDQRPPSDSQWGVGVFTFPMVQLCMYNMGAEVSMITLLPLYPSLGSLQSGIIPSLALLYSYTPKVQHSYIPALLIDLYTFPSLLRIIVPLKGRPLVQT